MSTADRRNGRPRPEGHPRLGEAVRADLAEMAKAKSTPYPSVGGLVDVLTLPGTWATILFRLGAAAHHGGLRPLSRLCYFANIVIFGCEAHPGAVVGPGLVMPHPVGLGFAAGVRMGDRCRLLRACALGGSGDPNRPGQPTLGDDVWIMDAAKVLGPVTVGDRTIVGANAIVVDDIPPDVFVYGPRKSTSYRALSELGLGEAEEAKRGYGRAAEVAAERAGGRNGVGHAGRRWRARTPA